MTNTENFEDRITGTWVDRSIDVEVYLAKDVEELLAYTRQLESLEGQLKAIKWEVWPYFDHQRDVEMWIGWIDRGVDRVRRLQTPTLLGLVEKAEQILKGGEE